MDYRNVALQVWADVGVGDGNLRLFSEHTKTKMLRKPRGLPLYHWIRDCSPRREEHLF
jgi:hypothetical protein